MQFAQVSPPRRRPARRRGLSIIYVVVMLVILIAFVAFAVDVGRLRLAREQLQTAADASACAGAQDLPSGPVNATDSANSFAGRNKCLGDAVTLNTAQDVDFGLWTTDDHTYHKLPYTDIAGHRHELREANAIHVMTRRIGPSVFSIT